MKIDENQSAVIESMRGLLALDKDGEECVIIPGKPGFVFATKFVTMFTGLQRRRDVPKLERDVWRASELRLASDFTLMAPTGMMGYESPAHPDAVAFAQRCAAEAAM